MVTLIIVSIFGDNPSVRSQSQEAQIFGALPTHIANLMECTKLENLSISGLMNEDNDYCHSRTVSNDNSNLASIGLPT
jgi:hypothetical protein